MRGARFVLIFGTLIALGCFCQPAWASQELVISCEGIESTGGGANRYQYTLKNSSVAAITLTDFFVGTEDPNAANYTFVPTAGFVASIIPNDAAIVSMTYTDLVKTAHGVIPPPTGPPSVAIIYWAGTAVLPAGGTITFAFDHPGDSVDEEWFANASGLWTISMVGSPIAGPLGTYTDGYVHAPQPPLTPAMSIWGVVALVALVVMVGVWMLIRTRRQAQMT